MKFTRLNNGLNSGIFNSGSPYGSNDFSIAKIGQNLIKNDRNSKRINHRIKASPAKNGTMKVLKLLRLMVCYYVKIIYRKALLFLNIMKFRK